MGVRNRILLLLIAVLWCFRSVAVGTPIKANKGIYHDTKARVITITDPEKYLSLVIDYSRGCKISSLKIKGKNVLSPAGVYTGFNIDGDALSLTSGIIQVKEQAAKIVLNNINYTDGKLAVSETWSFSLVKNQILWNISRTYDKDAVVEESYFPKWNFANLSTWKGGMIDNGGMVWCKYLGRVNDTYGVHTAGVTFWEPGSGDALRIAAKTDKDLALAAKFSHTEKGEFTFTQVLSDSTLGQRYNLSRFVSGRANVFAPFKVKKGAVNFNLTLEYVDYNTTYSRGNLVGIDSVAVRELLNTTGRYGVVDNNIVGANGWITNWKCLHEPFFAQIGMAVNDANYTANLSATLDQERDLAMLKDGRVLSRWHNAAGDEIPGTYNAKTGYYEAMWGYTVDSQTGYIINTAEQFDLTGDRKWLLAHKLSAEAALNWLIRRDENSNGIFEMMNNNIAEQKASDWLDIVWASYENAFVNAQMYEALNLWANCERILGDLEKAKYYSDVANRLKIAFNKPVESGGFWSEAKQQFVYWRDKDGSIHGDNLVTPVNFAVIAFGLCDDPKRIAKVLDQIEQRNVKENLFHWPLCFDSFKREEVSPGNWPFPTYENGDIFPTWGYLGVRAYAGYDKGIALKYIKNLLAQYHKDGLSSQRYSRTTQKGLGEDILSGICTSITALYRDIYGLRPKWNRIGLEPNMLKELNGTSFSYTLRDTLYHIQLNEGNYTIGNHKFSVKSTASFGVSQKADQLSVYKDNKDDQLFLINSTSKKPVDLTMNSWTETGCSWSLKGTDRYQFIFSGLKPGATYHFKNEQSTQQIKVGKDGSLVLKNINGSKVFSISTMPTKSK